MRKLELKKTLELKDIKINDDYPLIVCLSGKSSWKINQNGKFIVEHLLNREEENYTFTIITQTQIKPLFNKDKIITILNYFFRVCDGSCSPQSIWRTEECNYESLLLNYDFCDAEYFDAVFDVMIKEFPELKQEENFLEELPKKETLKNMVSEIEIAYPETWSVDYCVIEK